MKPRIAVDCDGVVLSWRQGFSKHVRDVLGIQLTEEDFRKGDCGDYPSFAGFRAKDIDWLLDSYFREGPAVLEDPDLPGYWQWLESWAEPVIVTNRPAGCSTKERLLELGIDAEVVNNVGAKTGWPMLVDDWSEHCRSNEEQGGRSILFRQAWSGEHSGVAVGSWAELVVDLAREYEIPEVAA